MADRENNAISQTCLCDARRQVTSERCDILLDSKGEQGIWQRRFWGHQIRNEIDFTNHVAPVGATCLLKSMQKEKKAP